MGARVLMIETADDLSDYFLDQLSEHGHQITPATSPEAAFAQLEKEDYDLVLLNPELDSEQSRLLESLSKHYPGLKLIILSVSHSVELTVKAVRFGVVDYIQKPYQISEILEGIHRALAERDSSSRREVLIRSLASTLEQLQDVEGIRRDQLPARRMLKLPGGVLIDLERRQIWQGDRQVGLTPTESNLLSVFVENRERVLSHVELVALLQGEKVGEEQAPEILRPMVSRLRKKLAHFPGTEKWVKNIRGTGYLFEPV